jgi:hypothetical protein
VGSVESGEEMLHLAEAFESTELLLRLVKPVATQRSIIDASFQRRTLRAK